MKTRIDQTTKNQKTKPNPRKQKKDQSPKQNQKQNPIQK